MALLVTQSKCDADLCWAWFVPANQSPNMWNRVVGTFLCQQCNRHVLFFSPKRPQKSWQWGPGYWEWVINRNAASSALSVTRASVMKTVGGMSYTLTHFTCSMFSICSKVLLAHSPYSTLSVYDMENKNHSQTSPFLFAFTSIIFNLSEAATTVLHVYWCHWLSLRLFKRAAFNCIHLVSLTAGFWETIRVNKPKAAPVSHVYVFVSALIS